MQTLTFDQIPTYLLGIGEKLTYIEEQLVANKPSLQEIEKPTDVDGAADHTNLDYQTIYRLVRLKKIPFHKQGRKLYFFKSELNDWIKSGKTGLTDCTKEQVESRFLGANKNRRG